MDTPRLVLARVETLLRQGALDEAEALLRRTLKEYPRYTGARVALGRICLEQGRGAEAVEILEQVVQEAPDNLLARRLLARAYQTLGERGRARAHLEHLLALYPRDRQAREMLAMLEEAPSGDEVSSTAAPPASRANALQETLLSGTGSPEALPAQEDLLQEEEFVTETMADLLVSQGDRQQAARIYRRLLERDPENHRIRQKLQALEGKIPGPAQEDLRTTRLQRLETWLSRIQERRRPPAGT